MPPPESRCIQLHDEFSTHWFTHAFPLALDIAQQELESARQVGEAEHPAVLRALLDLAMAYQANGQTVAAEETERQAVELTSRLEERSIQKPDDPLTASFLIFDADRWSTILGDDEERVLSKYRRALTIREKIFGPHHPEVADVISRLGEVEYLRGHYEAAAAAYQRSVMVYEKSGNLEQLWYGQALRGLGQSLFQLERYAEAEPFFARALTLADKNGKKDRSLYFLLLDYADCLERLGNSPIMALLRERAAALLPKNNPGEFGFKNT